MLTIAVNDGRSFLEEQGPATGPGHGKDPGQGPYTGVRVANNSRLGPIRITAVSDCSARLGVGTRPRARGTATTRVREAVGPARISPADLVTVGVRAGPWPSHRLRGTETTRVGQRVVRRYITLGRVHPIDSWVRQRPG